MDETEYIVYAIQSEVDSRIYVGFTGNIENRLKWHEQGKTRSTKGFLPWKLIYTEIVENRAMARKRELYLKSGCGKEFLKKLPQSTTNKK